MKHAKLNKLNNTVTKFHIINDYPLKTAAAKCPPLSITIAQHMFNGSCSIL